MKKKKPLPVSKAALKRRVAGKKDSKKEQAREDYWNKLNKLRHKG